MKKTQIGTVVSDKMQHTAVVEVVVWKIHRIMKKRYQRHEKYMAENPENSYKTGDMVEITESKPLSRHKRWIITQKLDRHAAAQTKATPKKPAKKERAS